MVGVLVAITMSFGDLIRHVGEKRGVDNCDFSDEYALTLGLRSFQA